MRFALTLALPDLDARLPAPARQPSAAEFIPARRYNRLVKAPGAVGSSPPVRRAATRTARGAGA
ncbi:MAG: hypothetical protein WC538_12340 [Thermoanaerobaculia bacterium]